MGIDPLLHGVENSLIVCFAVPFVWSASPCIQYIATGTVGFPELLSAGVTITDIIENSLECTFRDAPPAHQWVDRPPPEQTQNDQIIRLKPAGSTDGSLPAANAGPSRVSSSVIGVFVRLGSREPAGMVSAEVQEPSCARAPPIKRNAVYSAAIVIRA